MQLPTYDTSAPATTAPRLTAILIARRHCHFPFASHVAAGWRARPLRLPARAATPRPGRRRVPRCRLVCHAPGVAASPPPAPMPPAAAPQHVPPSAALAHGRAARATSPTVQLALSALTIALILGTVLVAPLPLWAGQPVGPPAAGTEPPSAVGWPGLVVALVLVLGLCLPFRPYRHALDAASRLSATAAGTRLLVGLTAALALVALLIYPRFGSDIFDYVGFERTWVVYGQNPLIGRPSSH